MGVSLSFDKERDLPEIVGIEPGTPAAEAGLEVGALPRPPFPGGSRSTASTVVEPPRECCAPLVALPVSNTRPLPHEAQPA